MVENSLSGESVRLRLESSFAKGENSALLDLCTREAISILTAVSFVPMGLIFSSGLVNNALLDVSRVQTVDVVGCISKFSWLRLLADFGVLRPKNKCNF